MSKKIDPQLSPTDELVLEVLAARYRLGETWWPIQTSSGRAIRKLEGMGLIKTMHGVVEKTVRCQLSEEGIKQFCVEGYEAPVFKKYKLLEECQC